MVGIINYKAGNSTSVKNALDLLGVKSIFISNKNHFEKVNSIILPGVGSAKATMDSLKEMGIIDILEKKVLIDKVPFLGICVGLQVLFEHSDEGDVNCLSWLKGVVKKFDNKLVRIPQMGWNEVVYKKDINIVKNKTKKEFYYFVNSYYVIPKDRNDILATTDYGNQFVSMINKENIYGVQCHIEKSGEVGLELLETFVNMGLNNVN